MIRTSYGRLDTYTGTTGYVRYPQPSVFACAESALCKIWNLMEARCLGVQVGELAALGA